MSSLTDNLVLHDKDGEPRFMEIPIVEGNFADLISRNVVKFISGNEDEESMKISIKNLLRGHQSSTFSSASNNLKTVPAFSRIKPTLFSDQTFLTKFFEIGT